MLDQLLKDMVEREGAKAETMILPEAAIARLQEALPRFQGDNPWKVGDIVTIRKDTPFKGAGKPVIVVRSGEVNLSRAIPDCGDWTEGVNFNVEFVGVERGELIVPHLVPHWALERYEEAELAKAA